MSGSKAEHTLTTEQVEDGFAHEPEYEYSNPVGYGAHVQANRRAFRRWLARVRAEAQIEALMGFVADVTDQVALTDKAEGNEWASEDYRHGLRSALMQVVDRAARVAREAGIEQEDEG